MQKLALARNILYEFLAASKLFPTDGPPHRTREIKYTPRESDPFFLANTIITIRIGRTRWYIEREIEIVGAIIMDLYVDMRLFGQLVGRRPLFCASEFGLRNYTAYMVPLKSVL